MSVLIQLKRGLKADVPATGSLAEPIFCTDTDELAVWNGTAWVYYAAGAATDTQFSNEFYVDATVGLDTNGGKNQNERKQTLSAVTPVNNSFIYLAYGSYDAITLNNLQNVVVKGIGQLGKVQTVLDGGQTLSGSSARCGYQNVNIASNSANTAITISSSGGYHVFENIGSNLNTAATFIQHGVSCHSANPAAPKNDAKYFNLDMTTVSGEIVLPDLAAGQYASIQLIDCLGVKVSVGDGWFVFKSRSYLDAYTFTGSATPAQVIDMDSFTVSDTSSIDLTYNPVTKQLSGEVLAVDAGTF